jgi:Ca2+-binding RTX toxin-like protein
MEHSVPFSRRYVMHSKGAAWATMLISATLLSGVLSSTTRPVTASAALLPVPDCTVMGTSGIDRPLEGTDGDDVICGLGGADKIKGGGGDDIIYGGPGRDLIYGHAGDDIIFGGSGGDELRGGRGTDRVRGGRGKDLVGLREGSDKGWGGPGRDGIAAIQGSDVLKGGKGEDFLCARDEMPNDTLLGGPGRDRFYKDIGDVSRLVERRFSLPACG